MSTETFFKIRKKGTNLYSSGGALPKWKEKGKKWSNIGHLKNHLAQVSRRGWSLPNQADYASAEIVTFEATVCEMQTQTVAALIAEAEQAKADKEAKAAEALRQAKEARERETLRRLQAKYPNG